MKFHNTGDESSTPELESPVKEQSSNGIDSFSDSEKSSTVQDEQNSKEEIDNNIMKDAVKLNAMINIPLG